MAFAKLLSRAQLGIDAPQVSVEVHLSGGLPSFAIVGLAETAVRESRERVRSALINSGFAYPQSRITVNLAPADLPKEGGRYDLAIALGILLASHQLNTPHLENAEIYGELGLDGELRSVKGLFPAAFAVSKQKSRIIIPPANVSEAWLAGATDQLTASNLFSLCDLLSLPELPARHKPEMISFAQHQTAVDLSEVCGQTQARRALEIAASGAHNLLFTGPPGSGKSLLASCVPGLLPELTGSALVETAAIYSVAGLPVEPLFKGNRPYRSPHHSASAPALVGGGSSPRPGEISLAHHGILFLDELPEFSRSVLEVLREPLETGEIMISRASGTLRFPANFSLIAARNPCPCGYSGDGSDRCVCSQSQISRYQARISGPLLDRFDMLVSLEALPPELLLKTPDRAESSATVAKRVVAARAMQLKRQNKLNAQLKSGELMSLLASHPEIQAGFSDIATRLKLSARSCHRVLRVARTIADMDATDQISWHHLLEAVSYREQGRVGGTV